MHRGLKFIDASTLDRFHGGAIRRGNGALLAVSSEALWPAERNNEHESYAQRLEMVSDLPPLERLALLCATRMAPSNPGERVHIDFAREMWAIGSARNVPSTGRPRRGLSATLRSLYWYASRAATLLRRPRPGADPDFAIYP